MPSAYARIRALSSYLPQRVLTNQDLEKMVDTQDEWIVSRVGIKERRLAAPEQSSSDMACLAARALLKKHRIEPSSLDLIILTSMSPDYMSPSTACIVQGALGAKCPAFDIQAACTGFIYALSVAKAYIESKMARRILLISTEKNSSLVDFKDRNTCCLFGDGAVAALIEDKGEGFLIPELLLGSDGEHAELLYLPAGGSRLPSSSETLSQGKHFLQMQGNQVYRHGILRMEEVSKACLEKAQLKASDLAFVVPHQANLRMIQALAKRLGLPQERFFVNIEKYGNTSSAAVGIALEELIASHSLAYGDRVMLVAFGAGLTWGATILKKVEK